MSQESIRVPAAGTVFWAEANADGTFQAIAGAPPAMQVKLMAPLPQGIVSVSGSLGLVLQTSPIFYSGQPSEAQLASPPSLAAFTVSGTAQPLDGRFHPRAFTVSPTRQAPSYVPLRPSLQGTSIGEAGALMMNLQWQPASGRTAPASPWPASWSIVNLVGTRNGAALAFTGQADVNGDIIVPLTGLPPLPAAQTSDSLTMTMLGDQTQSGLSIGNPDALAAVSFSIGSGFAAQQTLSIQRGGIITPATLAIPGFTLQAS